MPIDRRRAWRIITLSSLAVGSTSCTSLRRVPEPMPEPLPAKSQQEVRLILRDGRAIFLREAQVVGDSIVGLNTKAQAREDARYAVNKADVVEVAVRRGDAFKTVLAVAGGFLALMSFALLAACIALSNSYA